MPTMKSTYAVLGGSGLLALAVHPKDDNINEHFAGHDGLWKTGKYLGQASEHARSEVRQDQPLARQSIQVMQEGLQINECWIRYVE